MDVKEIKCPLQWWEKHESMFLICQVLGIVESQIEIEKNFYLVGILTNLTRYSLQSKNLEKLVNKNWSNDPQIGCESPQFSRIH